MVIRDSSEDTSETVIIYSGPADPSFRSVIGDLTSGTGLHQPRKGSSREPSQEGRHESAVSYH